MFSYEIFLRSIQESLSCVCGWNLCTCDIWCLCYLEVPLKGLPSVLALPVGLSPDSSFRVSGCWKGRLDASNCRNIGDPKRDSLWPQIKFFSSLDHPVSSFEGPPISDAGVANAVMISAP